MLEKLTIVAKASAMARHAAARHRVIAENVANADTPGFRAQDLRPFSELVNAGKVNQGFTMRATREGHLHGHKPGDPPFFERVDTEAPTSPNGNTVNLETESLRAVETTSAHSLAVAVYSKTADILRLGIGRNR